jgi:predicted AAA+ superfamily ATPase
MKPIKRHIETEARDIASQFRAVCLVGPRQSGKTTLSRIVFDNKIYVNLENPNTQAEALADLSSFLKKYKKGAVLDEVQRVPDLFRYMQQVLDDTKQRGLFILTGSNNFLLQHQISQSLAGRVGYLELLPLSYAELLDANRASDSILEHIFTGGYPELWQHKIKPEKWMSSYVQTYIQRDVRLLRNISNLGVFTKFVQLCATYAGQIVNKDAISKAIGVDAKTVQSWLAVLESSYIIYLLQPYHNNLSKRIVKSPKLYFYDTGMLAYLLNIHSESGLAKHEKYGAIFENWILTEIRKNRYNRGISGGMFYFRDSAGNEVDLILEKQEGVMAVEIKSAKRFNTGMLTGIRYWQKYNRNDRGILIMSSDKSHSEIDDDRIGVLGWQEVIKV